MKKILSFILLITCIGIVGCQKDEPKNELYGTKWMADAWLWSAFNGGTWYEVYEFTDNNVCSHYYQKTTGLIQSRVDNIKYTYKKPTIYFFDNKGDIEREFVVDGSSIHLKGNNSYLFHKQ